MAADSVGSDVKAAFFAGLAFVGLILAIDNATIGWLLVPLPVFAFLFAMLKAPMRASLLTLMFFGLALENPSEMPASDAWRSPFFEFGAVMLSHFKHSVGIPLPIGGMDVCFLVLAVVWVLRRSSEIRAPGYVHTPKPLIRLAQLSLASAFFVFFGGILRGGDRSIALWQLDRVFYLPIVFLLFQAGLRGPRDHEALAKVVLAAATLRSLQAIYVYETVFLPANPLTGVRERLDYATTHHDSMLFAGASVLLAALLIQRAGRSARLVAFTLLPILVFGMLANQRRMVWVQILAVLGVLYFVTAMNPIKRKLQRALLVLSPFIIAYVGLGWNRATGIFKPVATIRSAVDSDSDSSTMWRDIENFDLIFTIRQNPIFGTGYGHGFIEVIPLPAVDYLLERFIPHNSILGLWAYCGYIGYTGLTLLWSAGVYFSIRAYHAATSPNDKAAALTAFAAVPVHYLQCYGDMGLGSWTGVFLVAPALAVGGKLAVASGAWTHPQKRARGAPAPRAGRPPVNAPGAAGYGPYQPQGSPDR